MTLNMPAMTDGIVSRSSPYGVDETLQRIEQVIRARGLTLFAHFDHSGEAARAGLTMQPAHVLVFGNSRAGTPLMAASPLLALDLPLKALVWQDGHGQVWVSYQQPEFLAERYTIPPDLVKVVAAPEAIVMAAVAVASP